MKVWMMTGCSSGLGKQLMLEALKLGDRVAACVRRIETLEPFVRDYPEQLLPVALDVTSPQMIEAAVQRIGTHFNTIDGLINNAGYGYRAAIEEGEDAAIDTLFQTNFFGPMRLIRQVLPIMRKQKSGVIINISSRLPSTRSPALAIMAPANVRWKERPVRWQKNVRLWASGSWSWNRAPSAPISADVRSLRAHV